jgi:hypothetical protein
MMSAKLGLGRNGRDYPELHSARAIRHELVDMSHSRGQTEGLSRKEGEALLEKVKA